MSERDKAIFKERLIIAKDIAALIGPLIIAALVLWLKSEFVTRQEYSSLTTKIERIDMTLVRMESQQRQLDEIRQAVCELEKRIRVEELKPR